MIRSNNFQIYKVYYIVTNYKSLKTLMPESMKSFMIEKAKRTEVYEIINRNSIKSIPFKQANYL